MCRSGDLPSYAECHVHQGDVLDRSPARSRGHAPCDETVAHRRVRRLALLLGACLFAGSAVAGDDVTLEGAVIANGGTTTASAGDMTLEGTIAQPVVGPSGNGTLQLDAGFWVPALAPRPPSIFHDGFED